MAPANHDYDVIIVGARVAGTAAAIVLARQGRKVLLVDKAAFPADTLSTHIVLGGGAAVLKRLGVLEMLERIGGVRYSRSRTIGPGFDYCADLQHDGDDNRGLCLGRLKMDAAMLEAARAAGQVDVREQFRLTDLIVEDGAVAGIRGEDPAKSREFRAPLTIGADGMRSTFAKIAGERLNAFARTDVPCARAYYYAYFDGVPRARLGDEIVIEFESRPGAGALLCRCENDRTVAAVAFDAEEMRSFRTDLATNFARHVRDSFAIGQLLEGSPISGKIFSSGLLLNTYRVPVCDGALLLGDAGLHVDPLFGQGHSFALISAEIMGELAGDWFGARDGSVVSADALDGFRSRRDAMLMPYYHASVKASAALGLDAVAMLAHRVANREQWAADEMMRLVQMTAAPGSFPSFRFARQMARQARAA